MFIEYAKVVSYRMTDGGTALSSEQWQGRKLEVATGTSLGHGLSAIGFAPFLRQMGGAKEKPGGSQKNADSQRKSTRVVVQKNTNFKIL
ncbi:MAG: hypothetical protein SFW35_09440 [Chitinophagales bacterium]|nr:hypothetical protein [Chitinophagales bacterium]